MPVMMQRESEYLWDPAAEPFPELVALERSLTRYRYHARAFSAVPATSRRGPWRFVLAAVLIVAAVALAPLRWRGLAPWSVELLSGRARVDGAPLATADRVASGQRIDTEHQSTLRLAIARSGVADLAPQTRLLIVRANAHETRLRLERGTVQLTTGATPWVIVVDGRHFTLTDSVGTNTEIYSLSIDSVGITRINVREGEVEVVADARRMMITAGTEVELDATGRAGVPFPSGSAPEWRARLATVARGKSADSVLTPLLRAPAGAEVIALWHLATRVQPTTRLRIYDALTPLTSTGAAMRRDDVARLDSTAMEQWRLSLRPRWLVQPMRWRERVRQRFFKPSVPE